MLSDWLGGAEGNRTPDLVIANDALSQLSYGPAQVAAIYETAEFPVKQTTGSRRCLRATGLRPGATRLKSGRGTSASADRCREPAAAPLKPASPSGPMLELLAFISYLLQLYVYVLIAGAVFSWLLAFNVVNSRSQIVSVIGRFLYQVTEPVLRPVRGFLPNFGGIDISPIVVIIIIFFIQSVILPNLADALI